jgi:cytochrome c peroxidase
MLNTIALARRNASVAAPYLQDGTATTFPETVRLIARYQHGRQPSSENISSIVQFLDSLTSEAGERVTIADTCCAR